MSAGIPLVELDARFVGAGGSGVTRNGRPIPRREGVGMIFSCPCGCDRDCYVPFENPLDGGPAPVTAHPKWRRTGETIETLTLSPSVLRSKSRGGCGWHGWIRSGHAVTV